MRSGRCSIPRPACSTDASSPTRRSISWSWSASSRAAGTSCATTPSCRTSGDYFINYIGEDQVICVRDEDGQINVLLNTCRHRGNALCRAEQGRAKSFVCSYHGWNYDLDGRLIGVPGAVDLLSRRARPRAGWAW